MDESRDNANTVAAATPDRPVAGDDALATRPWSPERPNPAATAPPARVLGTRYRLQEMIGRGGTATVHRAWDGLLHRDVAVKVFEPWAAPGPADLDSRITEMQALAAVDHPGLVAVYDATVADPADPAATTYLVMELVAGSTLADRLADGAVPEPLVRAWGVTLAGALADVHAAGLVHRDVKPANVLLGASGAVKLGDFGLARTLHADARITPGPDVIGTPAYLSPEQAASDPVGPPTDVYALGLVLLECLTGRREYPGEAISSALARLLRSPVVPDDLPAPWPRLLDAMTAREPERRPDAATVLRVLTAGSSPATAWPPSLEALFTADDAPVRRRGRAGILVAAGSAAVVAATVLGVLFGQRDPDASTPVTPAPVAEIADPSTGTSAGAAGSSTAPATTPTSIVPADTGSPAAPTTTPEVAVVPVGRTTTDTPAPIPAPAAAAEPAAVEPVAVEPAASEPVAAEPAPVEPPSAPAEEVPPVVTAEPTEAEPGPAEPEQPGPDAGSGNPGNGNGNGNGNGGGSENGGGNGNGGGRGQGNGGGNR